MSRQFQWQLGRRGECQQDYQYCYYYAERLEDDARMSSELEVVEHSNHVTATVGVGASEQAEHVDLVERLATKPLLATHDLQRHPAARLVVERTDHLTETAATEHLVHLVAAQTQPTTLRPTLLFCEFRHFVP